MSVYGSPPPDVDDLEDQIEQLWKEVKERSTKITQLQQKNTVLWKENCDLKNKNGRLTLVSLPHILCTPSHLILVIPLLRGWLLDILQALDPLITRFITVLRLTTLDVFCKFTTAAVGLWVKFAPCHCVTMHPICILLPASAAKTDVDSHVTKTRDMYNAIKIVCTC